MSELNDALFLSPKYSTPLQYNGTSTTQMNPLLEQMVVGGEKFLYDYFVLNTELKTERTKKSMAKSDPRESAFFSLSPKLTLVNFKNIK